MGEARERSEVALRKKSTIEAIEKSIFALIVGYVFLLCILLNKFCRSFLDVDWIRTMELKLAQTTK